MPKLHSEKGLLINQAQEILKKTYKEINKIKQETEDLLTDYDPTLKVGEEYSYGPKSLMLKANHTFLFKRERAESETIEKIFAIVVLLNDGDSTLKRVNLKEEPEIWFILLNVDNKEASVRPWEAYSVLTENERKNISKNNLRVDGSIFIYDWQEEDDNTEKESESQKDVKKEHWHCRLIGYPLTSIENKEFLENNVLKKLWQNDENGS